MADYTNPSGMKREIEQEAYRYYEEFTGRRLARDDQGNIRPQGHNDELDAFRHAYTSGRVTQHALGQQWVARHFGDDNEIGPAHRNDPYEHRMDLWNNEVGRRLGDDTSGPRELAQRTFEAMRDGTLVTGLSDPRLRQLYPDDPRLQRPAGDPEREILSSGDVDRINRDVNRALDQRQEQQRDRQTAPPADRDAPASPANPRYGAANGGAEPTTVASASHPGNGLFEQAMTGLRQSPNIPAGTFTPEQLPQVAANVAAASQSQGAFPGTDRQNERLDRIDSVLFNRDQTTMIAVQGQAGDPNTRMAGVGVAAALSTPIETASLSLQDSLERQNARQQALGQNAPQQQQDQPSVAAPRMA
ncbi:MAG: hypothetical protein E6Q50_15770 [Lysobacter sp.]|nr:MAG: hypothetical protein E6Q50_15770 [Lysobacter sp.]